MVNRNQISRRLAAVLLAGRWTSEALRESLKSALCPHHRKARWIAPLAERIVSRFEASRLPPTERQLGDFLKQDELLWDKISQYDLEEKIVIDLLALPRPEMRPGPRLPGDWQLPAIVSPGDLAAWCQVEPTELDWLADRPSRERVQRNPKLQNYHYRWLKKRSGGFRLIEEPKPRLKSIQRQILSEILNRIPSHEAAHGFQKGRSVLSYVAPHVGRHTVLHLDLRHFFPSISRARITSLFRWVGYPEAVANLLAGLCTNAVPGGLIGELPIPCDSEVRHQFSKILSNPHLPQGAPTSPALANLAAYRLDCRLAGLARKTNVSYTRYADDLTFSGGRRFGKKMSPFRIMVCAIVIDEGFEIRRRKTRVLSKGTRQEVAGVVLNQHPNLRRDEYDRLRAILHNCQRHGPESQNRERHERFKEHLRGRIAHHRRINPNRGEKLTRLFDQIRW